MVQDGFFLSFQHENIAAKIYKINEKTANLNISFALIRRLTSYIQQIHFSFRAEEKAKNEKYWHHKLKAFPIRNYHFLHRS